MIGQLKKFVVRTVYDKKVCRVQIDIPIDQVRKAEVGGQDFIKFLEQNVDKEIGVKIGGFEDEEQELIAETEN